MKNFLPLALSAALLLFAGCVTQPRKVSGPVPVSQYYPEQFAALEQRYKRIDAQVVRINALSKRARVMVMAKRPKIRGMWPETGLALAHSDLRRYQRKLRASYAAAGLELDRGYFRLAHRALDSEEQAFQHLEDMLSELIKELNSPAATPPPKLRKLG